MAELEGAVAGPMAGLEGAVADPVAGLEGAVAGPMAGLEGAVAGPMARLEGAVAGTMPMAGMEGAVAAPAPPTTWRSLVLDDSPGPSGQVHSTCQVPPAKRQHMEQAHTPAAPALCSSLCGHSGGHEEGARDNDVLQGQVYTVYYRVRCVRCTAGCRVRCVLCTAG